MDNLLLLLLLLLLLTWSSGVQPEGEHISIEPGDVRLVGGASRCAGILELKHLGEWRPVIGSFYVVTAKVAAVFCEHLDCGSVVNVEKQYESTERSVWRINIDYANPGSALRNCTNSAESSDILNATCSALHDDAEDCKAASQKMGYSQQVQLELRLGQGGLFYKV
ncbi:unnamed protein product [Oreochromis niloticus]|nr:unnamed protein product [Mustela putorius furo]